MIDPPSSRHTESVLRHPIGFATPLLALALCAGPGVIGCTTDGAGNDDADETAADPEWPMAESEAERETDPQLTQAEIASIADDQLGLALDLYHALRSNSLTGESFSVSSYSVAAAFGMLYGGTTGVAREQMETTLHFSLGGERQHAAHNWLDQQLADRNLAGSTGPDVVLDPVVLQTANGVWALDTLGDDIEADYLDLLAVHYGTGVRLADFAGSTEREREGINLWVSNRTNALIPELLAPGIIKPTTTMVLVNALYLKAPWQTQFEEGATSKAPFTRLDGSTVDADLMHNYAMYGRYGQGDGYSAFAAPLRGNGLEVVFVVPDEFETFEATLDPSALATLLSTMEDDYVDTYIPRLELETDLSLRSVLRDDLGMPAPFEVAGSFDDIAPNLGVIYEVIHKTVIKVDENGTEAAAATAVILDEGDGGEFPEPVATFRADKPFILMIRDAPTQSVLFFGRVLEP